MFCTICLKSICLNTWERNHGLCDECMKKKKLKKKLNIKKRLKKWVKEKNVNE